MQSYDSDSPGTEESHCSGGSQAIDLNEEVEEELPSDAGAFASGFHSGLSAPVEELDENLDLQMRRLLIEVTESYERSTDPIAKGMYFELMQRLWKQLGLSGVRRGGGGSGVDGDGEEVANSNDSTE